MQKKEKAKGSINLDIRSIFAAISLFTKANCWRFTWTAFSSVTALSGIRAWKVIKVPVHWTAGNLRRMCMANEYGHWIVTNKVEQGRIMPHCIQRWQPNDNKLTPSITLTLASDSLFLLNTSSPLLVNILTTANSTKVKNWNNIHTPNHTSCPVA